MRDIRMILAPELRPKSSSKDHIKIMGWQGSEILGRMKVARCMSTE
jgi:hypothetical protein